MADLIADLGPHEFVWFPGGLAGAGKVIDGETVGTPSDTPVISPLSAEREAISAGGCPHYCQAHARPCILRAHAAAQPCYCVSEPGPVSRRMVRRATR